MAKLIILRKMDFMNMARSYRIYLDGKKLGYIANQQTQEFQVATGDHMLSLKIDWFGSADLPITLLEEETRIYLVKVNPLFIFSSLLTLAFLLLDTLMNEVYSVRLFLVLAIISGLGIFYFLSFGRKQYLVLTDYSDRWTEL